VEVGVSAGDAVGFEGDRRACLAVARSLLCQAVTGSGPADQALSVSDLVIAATAERSGATVLHYDGDYDMIASVTGQPMRWVVPAGTAD
jgi:predicted nucleic acid-binding protein